MQKYDYVFILRMYLNLPRSLIYALDKGKPKKYLLCLHKYVGGNPRALVIQNIKSLGKGLHCVTKKTLIILLGSNFVL